MSTPHTHLSRTAEEPGAPDATEVPHLHMIEMGGRAQGLIEDLRRTGGEILVLQSGRPVAKITPVETTGPPDEPYRWDVEAIGP